MYVEGKFAAGHRMFRDRERAENAYRSLSDRGYGKDDVNFYMLMKHAKTFCE